MTEAFNTAFERVIGHEGRFQDGYHDRGNWTTGKVGRGELKGTKFGIAAMSYPDEDIRNLTLARARELYYRDYWLRAECDELPGPMGYQVFDAAVNHGIGNAIRFLQRAARVLDDGIVGPMTLGAIKRMTVTDLVMRFNAERGEFMTYISTFGRYGKGWVRRVCENLRYGAEDA